MLRGFTTTATKNWSKLLVKNTPSTNIFKNTSIARYFSSAFDQIDDLEIDTNIEANLSVTDECLEKIMEKLVP
jgi:hypothetical protein